MSTKDAEQEHIIDVLFEHGISVAPDETTPGLLVIADMDGANSQCGLISRLKNVTALRLATNDLADDGFAKVCTLQGVLWMDLYRTKLTVDGYRSITKLKDLREVAMYGEELRGDAMAESICKLPKLQQLRMSECNLTPKGLALLAICNQIEGLDISANPIPHGFDILNGCKSLRKLVIEDVPITLKGAEEIGSLGNIRELVISGAAWNDEMMLEIAKLQQLRKLLIGKSPGITAKSIQSFGKLINLKDLMLPSQTVDEAHIHYFARLQNLARLNFFDVDQVPVKLLNKLRKILPECAVETC